MNRLLAHFFIVLLLLQTLGPELLVVNYELNKASITARYCVNKARPLLHCNGQCHLAQQLRKAEGGDKKAPTALVAKGKFEVLPLLARLVLRAPRHWPPAARRYAAQPASRYTSALVAGVFRPPLPQV